MTRAELVAEIEESGHKISSAESAAEARDAIKRRAQAVRELASLNRLPVLPRP